MSRLRLGTRGSTLALVQARAVATALEAAGVETEIVTVTTLGDRGAADRDKSRWVSELERALAEERVDLAVHSAKDLPTELPAGLEIVAVPVRADAHDALCGAAGLDALAPGARVGTASLRRSAQLRAVRPDLDVAELRGNVDTRLGKLAAGEVDALVLALAGLERLGRAEDAAAVALPLDRFVPAAGQGALALEARAGAIDPGHLAAVTDDAAAACLHAERTVVHALGASCDTPVGAHAHLRSDGECELTAWVGLPDGGEWLADTVAGSAETVGAVCAQRMLAAGARELLDRAERAVSA